MASNSSLFRGPQYNVGGGLENHDNMLGRGRTHQAMYLEHQRLMESSVPRYSGGGDAGNSRMGMPGNMSGVYGRREEPNVSSNPPSSYYASRDMEIALKTPISLLNEVCSKTRVEPVFELKEDGPPHDRKFICTVRVEKMGTAFQGTAEAKTKKDAKQDAARNLLVTMDRNVEGMLVPAKPSVQDSGADSSEPNIDTDPDPEGNPVGELNDITLKLKRIQPEYEDVSQIGKPHEVVFTVACKLGGVGSQIVEHGTGRTKKHAKKAAAFKAKLKLIEVIKQGEMDLDANGATATPEEEPNTLEDIVNVLKKTSISTKKKKSKAKKTASAASTSASVNDNEQWKLAEWLAEFKERRGEKLQSLQESGSTTDSIKLLREIANEQNFKTEYLDVEKPESEEVFKCIVSIGIEPVAIFMGQGESKTQARKTAAKSALEFLKIAIGR